VQAAHRLLLPRPALQPVQSLSFPVRQSLAAFRREEARARSDFARPRDSLASQDSRAHPELQAQPDFAQPARLPVHSVAAAAVAVLVRDDSARKR
jgi:hypothetical protein